MGSDRRGLSHTTRSKEKRRGGSQGDAPADPDLEHPFGGAYPGAGPCKGCAGLMQGPHPMGNRVVWRPDDGTLARAAQRVKGRRRVGQRSPRAGGDVATGGPWRRDLQAAAMAKGLDMAKRCNELCGRQVSSRGPSECCCWAITCWMPLRRKAHRITQVARAVEQWAGAVRIVRPQVRGMPCLRVSPITGAGLDPSCAPAGIPSSGSDGEGCWGRETAGTDAHIGIEVVRVVAVPEGGAGVDRIVDPGPAAQQLNDPPSPSTQAHGAGGEVGR